MSSQTSPRVQKAGVRWVPRHGGHLFPLGPVQLTLKESLLEDPACPLR